MKIEQIKIKELKASVYNPRKWDDKIISDMTESIKRFGLCDPLIVNGAPERKNIVIGGHLRLKVADILGFTEVPVVYLNIPEIEREQELNLRLNKNQGDWDEEKLKELDMDLLLEVGFGDEELQNLFDNVDVIDDDFDIEKAIRETKISRVKPGEIWELGEHRLLVGDSTSPEQVKKLMGEDRADIIYCDPPYNIGLDYSNGIGTNGKYGGEYTGKKDNKTTQNYSEFICSSIKNALNVAKPNCHFFYWCDEKNIWLTQTLFTQNKIENKRVCLWIKNNQNCTPQVAFNKAYEPCVYGVIGKPYLNRNFTNANELLNQEIGSGNQVHEEILDIINLWIVKRDNAQDYSHPTQKPVTLNEKPIKRCSAPGHIVFSGFAGGGSDLIACEQLNRKWRGIEIDLIFATVCIDRWEKFTNKKAKLIS
jgi:DNA modification methylase